MLYLVCIIQIEMNDKEALDSLRVKHQLLIDEVGKVIVGQHKVVKEVTMAVV